MRTQSRKLVAVVFPEAAETTVGELLVASDFSAFTILHAIRGRGVHGDRPNTWQGGNAQLEVILEPELLDPFFALLERLRQSMPLVAWVSDVEAWPIDKFVRAAPASGRITPPR